MDETPEMIAAQQQLENATRRAEELAAAQAGLELERVTATRDAALVRAEMEDVKRQAERAEREIERASERVTRELDRQVREMKNALQAKRDQVNAALAPVKKRIALMQEGIETIDLYLSAASGVKQIRDGERADALETIVIRQMVLTMDEETGMFAEDGGMTAADDDAFDQWLLAAPDHLQQIIPERKAVVALMPRRSERERGNPWSHDAKDKVTHFLIRNGDAVFRTTVKDFSAGDVLIPRADEFVQFFRASKFNWDTHKDETISLQPNTAEYAEAMERSDARGRHFLRIGLILQGLVDNSDVFEPLHPAGVNMLTDPSERSEKVRIITDAEGGLESGQETFLAWQERVNAGLRPGMRIIGAFSGELWRDADELYREKTRGGHVRVHPRGWNSEDPPSGVPLLIEERRADGGLVVRYQREREIFDTSIKEPVPGRPGYVYRGAHRKPKTRASVTVYPSDGFILAYDLIDSSAQLRSFLSSRRNRREYQAMWPLLRSAMHAKRAEEQAEAPFVEMLSGVLARENGVTVEQAQADIPDLVRWFKLKNRWTRPLTLQTMVSLEAAERQEREAQERTASGRPSAASLGLRPGTQRPAPVRGADVEFDPEAHRDALEAAEAAKLAGREHEALAVRMIVAEHARRVGDRRRPINEKVVEKLRAEHPDAVLVVRPRRGGYLVLLPAHPTDNVWVHEIEFTAKGVLRERRDWRLVSVDRMSRWTVAYQHPRWEAWDLNASDRDHLRGPEIERLAERMLRVADGQPMMVSYRAAAGQGRGRFTVWALTDEGDQQTGPQYAAVDRYWRRTKDNVELQSSRSWYHSDSHSWTLDDDVDGPPWKVSRWARKHVGRIVWGPDTDIVARWTELRARHIAFNRADRELSARAQTMAKSVVDQWKAREIRARYEVFVADVPDAEWVEWEQHLRDNPPQWTWQDSHHHPYGALGALLRWMVGEGINPDGMTAQQALDHARGAGLPATWAGFGTRQHEFPQMFPSAWADLVIGAEALPLPGEPEQPAEEDAVRSVQDGVEILGAHDEQPEKDAFDRLRDAFDGLGDIG